MTVREDCEEKKKGQQVRKQKRQENPGHLVGGIFNLLLTAMRHSKACSQQKMATSSVVRRNSRVGNKTKRRHWSRSIIQGRERQSAGLRSAENPGAVSEKWNQGRKKVEFRPLSWTEADAKGQWNMMGKETAQLGIKTKM